MTKAERLSRISDLLLSKGEVNVESLRKEFGLSSVTIRKYLNQLEAEGQVQRTYGGAVLTQPNTQAFLPRVLIRNEILQFSHDKSTIAALAAREYIQDGDSIFIGCGDTCAAVAEALANRRINVVTNSILVAAIMATNPNAVTQVTGGKLCGYDRHFLYGDQLARSLDGLHFKTAFFGASGASYNGGFTSYSDFERSVFDLIRSLAERVVFVLGASKFGSTSFLSIAPLDAADCVVSDEGMPTEYRAYFEKLGIPVQLARL